MGLHKVMKKGWRYDFQINGRRYTKAWFPTKAAAIAAREEHRKQILTAAPTPTGTTFSALANEYLDHAQRRFINKTYKYKASVYRSFITYCGDVPLTGLTIPLVESYLRTRPSNTNYNSHRRDLCALFAWAWRRKLLNENPCLYINKLSIEKKSKQIYSQEDMVKLFLAAGELRPFLLALFSLAARVGEINNLRWEDVNFEKRQVTLWTSKGGTWREQPKAMNNELYEELLRLHSKKSGLWVFPNPKTGEPYRDRRRQIKRICKTAGVSYLGWHAIRHHVASLLVDAEKISLPTVQKMLGHANLTTTQIYVQELSDGMKEAAELLKTKSNDNAEKFTDTYESGENSTQTSTQAGKKESASES